MHNKYVIAIVGPTAIGKTSLSIKLGQFFNSEILSADSRQFYSEMAIGTAVPSNEELRSVSHHFIQHKSILDSYSVGDYEKDALLILSELFKTYDTAVIVGGSGLFMDAVIDGLNQFPEIDPLIREQLNSRLVSLGLERLSSELKQLDLETYNKIDLQNPRRVIRALEICLTTGQPFSSFIAKPKLKRPFKTLKIGLQTNRDLLYERINRRVDTMVEEGLVDEVRSLYRFKTCNALNTVGYKEILKYLEGDWTLDLAIQEIKKNTRRYAKRQLTWFRKDQSIKWFNLETPIEQIIHFLKEEIQTYEAQ